MSTSRGKIDNAYVIKVVGTDLWRALFDLQVEGTGPIDLRLYLQAGQPDTEAETWIYLRISLSLSCRRAACWLSVLKDSEC